MARFMACIAALLLASTAGGCTLVVGGLDERVPGAGYEDDGSDLGIAATQLMGHLDGTWNSDCVLGAEDMGLQYSLTVTENSESDITVDFLTEGVPGCVEDGEAWVEYINGSVRAINRGVLGYGGNVYGVAFEVDGHGMQFYTDEAAADASAQRLYGKDDWEAEQDFDLLVDVDLGDSALTQRDPDDGTPTDDPYAMGALIVLDSLDDLRTARPKAQPGFSTDSPDLDLEGADDELIAATFVRQ